MTSEGAADQVAKHAVLQTDKLAVTETLAYFSLHVTVEYCGPVNCDAVSELCLDVLHIFCLVYILKPESFSGFVRQPSVWPVVRHINWATVALSLLAAR